MVNTEKTSRSYEAEIYEQLLSENGLKSMFAEPENMATLIEQQKHAESYKLNITLNSAVSEEQINGSTVYTLLPSETPECIVLFIHGGAYALDATDNYLLLADEIAKRCNAELIFPIYPLAPNHTWEDSFTLLTEIYSSRLNNSEIPVIIMGDSSGGGLACAFSEYLAEIKMNQPDKLILISPWLDITLSNPSIRMWILWF